MAEAVNLSTPVSRREALRMVAVDDPGPHHAMLQAIFDLERTWREGPNKGEGDEFEQIYVTAFLLFLIGDPADTPRLYGAKFCTGNMDLGIGFDAEAIFGAGTSETLQWLSENGYADEHANLSEWLSQGEDPKIEDWTREVREYFYAPDGVLLLDPL
jgi:hypothetical protein